MANKVFLLCATLALCVLLTNASVYRTVVELDEDEATNQMRPLGPRCRREFQQEQHLRACQQWIRRQARRSRGGPQLDEELEMELEVEDDAENQWGPQKHSPRLLQQCCNELRQEDPMCVCPTLKQAAKAVRLQGQYGPFQARPIFQSAKHLPNICNIPQVGVCPFPRTPY